MGADLPEIELREFEDRLRAAAPGVELPAGCVAALHRHYGELRRWNRRLSLVGPGTADVIVERHYSESLLALSRIPRTAESLVDLGSGGGFPGLVLAAARPDLSVFLIEARERKWAFLEAASHRAALSVTCLNARVGPALPAGLPARIDVMTVRAVRLTEGVLAPLLAALAPSGSVLLWAGEGSTGPPRGFEEASRQRVDDSRQRYILEWRRKDTGV